MTIKSVKVTFSEYGVRSLMNPNRTTLCLPFVKISYAERGIKAREINLKDVCPELNKQSYIGECDADDFFMLLSKTAFYIFDAEGSLVNTLNPEEVGGLALINQEQVIFVKDGKEVLLYNHRGELQESGPVNDNFKQQCSELLERARQFEQMMTKEK